MELTSDSERRFWDKVIIVDGCACWEWGGQKDDFGYGRLKIKGKRFFAHRISYFLHNSLFDPSLQVQHKVCDNPGCVNPVHLCQGTQDQNMQDCLRKGRRPQGRQVYCAKVDESQVLEIRTSLDSQRDLARKFQISQAAISSIVCRRSWASVK
jgi:hypothetical protein